MKKNKLIIITILILLFANFLFSNSKRESYLSKTLKDHFASVNAVKFSSNGKYFSSCSNDNTIKIYSTSNWELIKSIKDHQHHIPTVAFSPDGKYFASGSLDDTINIYSTSNWKLIKSIKNYSKGIYSILFSSDSKYIATSGLDYSVKIYSTNNWTSIQSFDGTLECLTSISFSPNNKYFASHKEKRVKVPIPTGPYFAGYPLDSYGRPITYTYEYYNIIKIYSTYSWEVIENIKDDSGTIWSLTFSSNGNYLASGGNDNIVKIYSTSNWKVIKTLRNHLNDVYSISFSPDEKYLLTGSEDHSVNIYSTSDWRLIKKINDHSGAVNSLSFSPVDLYFASGSEDNTVKIYSLPLPKLDKFINNFVKDHINKWTQKGEYEKTTDYKMRMSKKEEKKEKLSDNARLLYEEKLKKYLSNGDIKIIKKYNADNETFELNISSLGEIILYVPIEYAKSFKENKDNLTLRDVKVKKRDNEFILSSIEIYNPVDNKGFIYNSNK